MLISVVTAVFNRADTIREAIASVQSQTHRETELVVQDGGSTDGTLDVLDGIPDARLTVVSEKDGGIYDGINRGIARAAGDVVGVMHSDDLFAAPDILSDVATAFADPQVDAVYGDLDYVAARDTSRVIRRWRSGPFVRSRLRAGWMPPHPTLYLRRRVFDSYGLYDTGYRIAADYDAVLRYFSQPGFRAVHIPRVFVNMRVGGESNASLGRIFRKSREDYRALRHNRIGGAGALIRKNASKIRQFIEKDDATT